MIDRGVIYAIVGDKYSVVPFNHWEWCKKSFESLKIHCPISHKLGDSRGAHDL